MLAIALAAGLTGCPGINSVTYGYLGIDVNAINSNRCNDGIKVAVEGIDEGWNLLGPTFGDGVRAKGDNWVWIEPGQTGGISWDVSVGSPSTTQPEGKRITVKAYCMRADSEPGLSQRTLALADYIVQRGLPAYNVLEMNLQVYDSGSDPDYTLTPPGLTIERSR